MYRFLISLALFVPVVSADTSAAAIARLVRESGLDPSECYRVRDLNFNKEDIKVYLTDGYLIFAKPVNGVRLTAVFSAEDEGGDAEVLVLPPHRSERRSLVSFTKSPNLDEHFRHALFIFTDNLGSQLLDRVKQEGEDRRSAEMGALLADTWSPVVLNITDGFQVRLANDLLAPRPLSNGLFFMAVHGTPRGNFDVVYEPQSQDQISVGQLSDHDATPTYDIWTSFPARSSRQNSVPPQPAQFALSDFRIEAAVEPGLNLKVVTRVKVKPAMNGLRAVNFEMSRRMQVTDARIDGEPAEVFERESLRGSAIRGSGDDVFLVVAPKALEADRVHEVELHHEGHVIGTVGNNVYAVVARGSWYPHSGAGFANHDVTFRYPKGFELVTAGEVVSDRTDGDWRVTERRTTSPIRVAGFNFGEYQIITVTRSGYSIEVCGNRHLEAALQPKPRQMIITPPPGQRNPFPRIPGTSGEVVTIVPPIPDPTARLKALANEIVGAFEFMASLFGPPNLKNLTVSPIPGTFGQGFPGVVYLSTVSYLDPSERPPALSGKAQQAFFSDILQAHEVAHQWWGNLVAVANYKDEWLTEALAQYSALLYIEKRKGTRTLDSMLDEFRTDLGKVVDGQTVESAGPIIWGRRLNSSSMPNAAHAIMYEKGAWILHMLRRRMGDERFFKMLGEVVRRYRFRHLTTEGFRQVAHEFLPPRSDDADLEDFFENWVYDTGLPTLHLAYSVKGKAGALRLTGTVTQSEVDEDFTTLVPVEIQFAKGSQTQWVRTSGEPAQFALPLRQTPTKVTIGAAILAKVK